ncbi:MAG: hypothetical protein ACM3XO_03005 [Bacteroidota bacterium]
MVTGNSTADVQLEGAQEPAADCREALIFIPGLTMEHVHSVEEISLLLADAMDRHAGSGRAKFRVGQVSEQPLQGTGKTRWTTIFRKDGSQEAPLVDVYELEYFHLFQHKLLEESLLVKISRIPAAVFPASIKLFRHYRDKTLSQKEKLQFVMSFFGLLLILLYAFLLLGAVVETVQGVLDLGKTEARQAAPATGTAAISTGAQPGVPAARSPLASAWQWLVAALTTIWAWLQQAGTTVVVILAGLGIVLPKSDKIRQMIANFATIIIALIDYLQYGDRRPVLNGQILSLLEHIAEKPEVEYTRVNILAYSFGSILALDTLFPKESDVPKRVKTVKCLVTIGSPFDFIHMLWPEYFARRTPLHGLKWFNIYSPTDVLSSNFRSHSKKVSAIGGEEEAPSQEKRLSNAAWLEPPMNIKYAVGGSDEDLSIWDVIHLVGFLNHGKYWDAEPETQYNAFDLAVPKMFKDSPVLR